MLCNIRIYDDIKNSRLASEMVVGGDQSWRHLSGHWSALRSVSGMKGGSTALESLFLLDFLGGMIDLKYFTSITVCSGHSICIFKYTFSPPTSLNHAQNSRKSEQTEAVLAIPGIRFLEIFFPETSEFQFLGTFSQDY